MRCAPPQLARYKFYLMSGFRDAEGRFVTWRDVDFRHSAVRVIAKPHWGFHPKNWEERDVPGPQKLIALLTKCKPANTGPDDPVLHDQIQSGPACGLFAQPRRLGLRGGGVVRQLHRE